MGLLSQDFAHAARIDAIVRSDIMLELALPRTQPNIYGFVAGKLHFVQMPSPYVGPLDLFESRKHCYENTDKKGLKASVEKNMKPGSLGRFGPGFSWPGESAA
jgi:hypothetical protein